jgi:hypothetical protein
LSSDCIRNKGYLMLQLEIQQANLSDSEASLFRVLLVEVAQADGIISSLENQFIDHLVPHLPQVEPATLQQVWAHSDILLSTCICLAVLNGRYPVEKARKVSQIAHSLGFSAKRLRSLEEQALRVIRNRGETISEEAIVPPPKVTDDRIPSIIQDAPFPELLSQLWYSDAELIQTANSITNDEMDILLDQEDITE